MIPTLLLPRYVKSLRWALSAILLCGGLQATCAAAPAAQAESAAPATMSAPATVSASASVPAPALGPALAEAPPVMSSVIPRPPELQPDVQFWIRVYSEVTTNEGLLHDEWDLTVVYAQLQFPADAGPRARGDAVDAARDRYVAALRRASEVLRDKGSVEAAQAELGEDEKRVLAIWGARATPERLLEASRSLRFQLGQADRFKAGIVRSGAWETHIAEALANLGLPPEIAALPHVESSFNPAAYSKVGAAGLWQFMRSTGRRYMRVDDVVDERLDPFRATEAAAQLLAFNYRILGTWPLALTAYNHGAAGMRRARDAMGTEDFVVIARRFRGPTFGFASRNFFPSFLAALTIDQNPEKYFGPIERSAEVHFAEVEMPGFARIGAVERAVGVPRNVLRELNPALRPLVWDGVRLLPRGYRLRLPASATPWSQARLAERIGDNELFAAQISERSHRVRRGDSLETVAARYGLAARQLADLNNLPEQQELRVGRRLRLPQVKPPLLAARRASAGSAALVASASAVAPAAAGRAGASAAVAPAAASTAVPPTNTVAQGAAPGAAAASSYVVRAGDTVVAIAARVGLSARELMRINKIRDADFIFEGQRLRVARDVATLAAAEEAPDDAALGATAAAAADVAEIVGTPTVAAASEPSPTLAANSRMGPASRRPARTTEPVTAAQAEAQSPSVGPDAGMSPRAADSLDLAVAKDGTIRVIAEETLGHYADWLGVSAAHLRELNRMKYGQAVLLGRKLQLDFERTPREQFEQRRREFHARVQSVFFEQRRILGTEVYIVRRGDSLWSITQKYAGVPVWLLQQYNPDLELGAMRAGLQLVVPRLEDATGG